MMKKKKRKSHESKLQFKRANIGNLLASRRVEERDVRIEAFAVGNRTLIAGTKRGTVRRSKLGGTRVEEFDLPRIGTTQMVLESADTVPATKVHRVFVDPTGSHVVLSTVSGCTYYLHANSMALKPVPLFEDARVESLSWDRGTLTPHSTGPVLLGTNCGSLYRFEIRSNGNLAPATFLFRLDISASIDSIQFERFPDDPKKLYVMCVTTSPSRFYEFMGLSSLDTMFSFYEKKSRLENFVELPSDLNRTELHFFGRHPSGQSESFAILTDIGVYHGKLIFGDRVVRDEETFMFFDCEDDSSSSSSDDDNDDDDYMTKYNNATTDVPISIALTEFHFILLYRTQVVIRSRLSPRTVVLQQGLVQDELLGLVTDASTHEIYAYSSSNVFRLHINDESRDVWRLYLRKANGDPRYFEDALLHCRNSEERGFVTNAQAEFHLNAQSYALAARYFSRTKQSFESVALLFLEKKEWNALYVCVGLLLYIDLNKNTHTFTHTHIFSHRYISEILHQRTKPEHKIQNTLLCMWLLEITLGLSKTDNELKQFLREQYENGRLNEDIVMSLLRSRGRSNLVLFFASLCKQHEFTISYLVSRGQFKEALDRIEKQIISESRVNSIMMSYSGLFITNEPERTIQLWKKIELPISHIISSLICYDRHWRRQRRQQRNDHVKTHFGLEYVEYCICVKKSEDKILHRYLLSLYESLPPKNSQLQDSVYRYLESNLDRVDTFRALRLCKRFRRDSDNKKYDTLRVQLLVTSNNLEDAVSAALSINDTDLAKKCANISPDTPLRRKLWTLIAKHVFQHEEDDVFHALIEVCEEMDSPLRLENVMSLLGDFSSFKDKAMRNVICELLRGDNKKRAEMRTFVRDLNDASKRIRRKTRDVQNRYGYVASDRTCDICDNTVGHSFYVFLCTHVFHVDCLVETAFRSEHHLNEEEKHRVRLFIIFVIFSC